MKSISSLLLKNKLWSHRIKKKDPTYFHRLAQGQQPEILWIGCSDSRVPTEVIVSAVPGEMFVHRNIANQVIATDFNNLSVIQYAVDALKVEHIIVCGHYGCGGVKAAMEKQRSDLLITNKWLLHIKDVYRLHQDELEALPEEERYNRLVELNVIEQVNRLSHTSIVQQAWREENRPMLHGMVYALTDGILNPLVTMSPDDVIDPIYQYVDPAKDAGAKG